MKRLYKLNRGSFITQESLHLHARLVGLGVLQSSPWPKLLQGPEQSSTRADGTIVGGRIRLNALAERIAEPQATAGPWTPCGVLARKSEPPDATEKHRGTLQNGVLEGNSGPGMLQYAKVLKLLSDSHWKWSSPSVSRGRSSCREHAI